MIWIIQRYFKSEGEIVWHNARDLNGEPLWFFRKCDAQIHLRDHMPRGRFRIIKVKD